MNKSIAITSVVIGIVIVIGLGLFLINSYNNSNNTIGTGSAINADNDNNSDNSDSESGSKTFVITGRNFKFYLEGDETENPELRVKQGDRVRIEFSSEEGLHDLVIDEFNAATARAGPGTFTYVEFVADKQGNFEYYCSVGNHRSMGMFGKFRVV
ncbi:MAG TPA: multicopper oxidase domain-containing protein [Candidatus Nanoarchaeia archaeon]|nr:multicopper oxidase domain-containing protein [Candidatus Nanoarchaeia archaeon]